jgi:hypothetical protein
MFLNGMASSFDVTPGLGEREQTALALIALSKTPANRLPRPRYVRRWNTFQPMRHGRLRNLSCLLSCKRRLPLRPNCPKMKPRKLQKGSDASSRAYANPSNDR